MKKTRTHSIIFVMAFSLLLFAAAILIMATGFGKYRVGDVNTFYICVLTTIVVLGGGFWLVTALDRWIFGDVVSQCLDCYGEFKEDEVKKQIEDSPSGMYVSYRCPHCEMEL